MPSTLNQDILSVIVAEICKFTPPANNQLTTFMLSGQEPFEAALNFFARADRVAFERHHFLVYGKNWCFDNIPYDFGLLQPMLKVLLKNVVKIDIENCPTIKGLSILEQFITRKIKEVKLCDRLPARQMTQIHGCDLQKINVAKYIFHLNNHGVFYDFFMASAATHEITGSAKVYDNFSDGLIFDKVKKLKLCHSTYIEQLKRVFKFLSSSFPNLQTIEADFLHYGYLSKDWMSGLPLEVKGKISVYVFCWHEDTKTRILEEYGFDKKLEFGCKTYDVHDGLVVKVKISN